MLFCWLAWLDVPLVVVLNVESNSWGRQKGKIVPFLSPCSRRSSKFTRRRTVWGLLKWLWSHSTSLFMLFCMFTKLWTGICLCSFSDSAVLTRVIDYIDVFSNFRIPTFLKVHLSLRTLPHVVLLGFATPYGTIWLFTLLYLTNFLLLILGSSWSSSRCLWMLFRYSDCDVLWLIVLNLLCCVNRTAVDANVRSNSH